ncbi:Ig-like domain-containing protein [Longimicrobium sp.]|uniref:Ig-like domain-containing protein n=1 Tax=Longimicrobium sp. TaxID=2029185 RepID=UPI003B3A9461
MRHISIAAIAVLFLALAGCEPGRVTQPQNGTLSVQVNVASATIAGLTLEVTGPGITEPLLANLTLSGATASTSIEVPAGAARRFVVKGYDAAGILVYQGEKTSAVQPGQALSLAITLSALTSGATVTVTVGAVTVTLTPGATQLAVGATSNYTASASDNGVAVVNPQISWASTVPTIASVSATGTVTAHAPGTARIVATFRGVAAGAEITVQE